LTLRPTSLYLKKNAQAANFWIKNTGTLAFADVLVAGQMHSDNVGQDWYDNLSATERAWYLSQQSTAELLPAMVLGRILGRGLKASDMTQNIFKLQKNAVEEWSKHTLKSTFLGIGEEALTEGVTGAFRQGRLEVTIQLCLIRMKC
jgi:hypothetical protein